MKIDKSIIKELSNYLEEFNLTEIEITEKDTKIKVSKNNVSISNQPAATSANITARNENVSKKTNIKSGTEITSPIIGTAYHAPEPGAKKNITSSAAINMIVVPSPIIFIAAEDGIFFFAGSLLLVNMFFDFKM